MYCQQHRQPRAGQNPKGPPGSAGTPYASLWAFAQCNSEEPAGPARAPQRHGADGRRPSDSRIFTTQAALPPPPPPPRAFACGAAAGGGGSRRRLTLPHASRTAYLLDPVLPATLSALLSSRPAPSSSPPSSHAPWLHTAPPRPPPPAQPNRTGRPARDLGTRGSEQPRPRALRRTEPRLLSRAPC